MVADKKSKDKDRKYLTACHRIGLSFLPAVMEIFGNASDELLNLIKALVERASNRSHIPFHVFLPYWIKRISMTVQKGNAKHWFDSHVRMTGGTVYLQDSSLAMATHHLRI